MEKNDIDFLAVNELKVSEEKSNMLFNSILSNFSVVLKTRTKNPDCGGGVAIIFKKSIVCTELNCFDYLDLELVAVEAETSVGTVAIIAYYNPPPRKLNKMLFLEVQKRFKNFIICGDLNAHSESLGMEKTDSSGRILEEVLASTNMLILNDDKPTYYSYSNPNYCARLDLIISSPSIEEMNTSCVVVVDQLLRSDHFPVVAQFNLRKQTTNSIEKNTKIFDYWKADWPLFKQLLQNLDPPAEVKSDVELFSNYLTAKVLEAAEKSIPLKSNRSFCKTLPKHIVHLIRMKNKVFWKWRKSGSPFDKEKLASYSKEVSEAIVKFRSNQWKKFLEYVKLRDRNFVSSAPFWKRIKKFRSKPRGNDIPKLHHENRDYKTAKEMADLFGSILSKIFSDSNDTRFDSTHRSTVEETVKTKLASENRGNKAFSPITMEEMQTVLKKVNNKSSAGEDRISNILIKQLPNECLQLVLDLVNLSLIKSQIPISWKSARIRMIPKKKLSTNPTDFRPVSLTSCFGKLVERLVGLTINDFLKKKNFIIKQQSGFRQHRRTTDNLVFLTQKIKESFLKGKKILSVFFDISKAFDSVWHNGLIFKLFDIGLPNYLVFWIADFLSGRTFVVIVNGEISARFSIYAGVPQGAAISPLLFTIYINDVPVISFVNLSETLLFADDVVTFFVFEKASSIQQHVRDYMFAFGEWLSKWRLKASASKCTYTVFVGNGRRSTQREIVPQLYGENLPYEEYPKLLGVYFDPSCCFSKQTKEIKKRVLSRLNILKIISQRSWSLDKSTLTQIYNSLIRSVLDYSFFTIKSISNTNMRTFKSVQNNAIRLIHRLPRDTHTKDLLEISGLKSLENRFSDLGRSYIKSCIDNANPLMMDLFKEYDSFFHNTAYTNLADKIKTSPTFLCEHHNLIHPIVQRARRLERRH